MKEKLTNSIKKTQSFTLTRSSSISESSKSFSHFSVKGKVDFKVVGAEAGAEFGQDWGRDSSSSNGDATTTSKEVSYSIDKEISVPPFSKVQVMSYVNWIENLPIPYKAKITVTGVYKNSKENKTLDSQALKNALQKIKFDEHLLNETSTSLIFETHGTIMGSFGLDSAFTSTFIGKTRNTTDHAMSVQSSSINGSNMKTVHKYSEIYNYFIEDDEN
jgi:hypothetical protein